METGVDRRLWLRAREGDSAAFGELFERHVRSIHAYCFRRTGDWALAEDLASVTFLEAWRRRDVDLADGQVLPWLYGVASNVLRNSTRSRRRFAAALARLPHERAEVDFAERATERIADEQRVGEVLELLRHLPRREQEAVALVWWQGLSPAEAASAQGVREATIRTRLHRARRALAGLHDHRRVFPRPEEGAPRP